MNPSLVDKGIPIAVAVVGTVALGAWVRSYTLPVAIKDRPLVSPHPAAGPQTGGPPAGGSAAASTTSNPAVVAASLPGKWPSFRGPNRDNVSSETEPLNRNWTSHPPRQYWKIDVGEGYAGAAVLNGRVFVLDYDMAAQADALRCLSLADGQEIWRRSYPVVVKRNHGMSRTVPAVTDKYVVTLGPKCQVMCCDPVTGKEFWRKDLVAEFGATVPEWYAGQCPLIDGDRVILAPGGQALMIAVALATGKVVWQSPNPRRWTMTHSSIVATSFKGRPMYVYCGSGGVVGINAKDGSILWETTDWVVSTATVPSPLPVGEGRIFLSGGYDSGALMLQLEDSGGKIASKTLYRLGPTVFGSDQQTPILYKGSIYGVIPGGQLACLDPGGKQRWVSGSMHRFGLGPYMVAGGLIYAMDDSGVLTMAEADPKGYHQLGQIKILEGPDAWGPFAIAGGRLIARDLTKMICIDVAGR